MSCTRVEDLVENRLLNTFLFCICRCRYSLDIQSRKCLRKSNLDEIRVGLKNVYSIKKTISLQLVTFCGNHRSFSGDLPILMLGFDKYNGVFFLVYRYQE